MMIRTCIILAALFLVTTSVKAEGEGIPVEPGMWEISFTMNMPMMPQPHVTNTTECMKDAEISMDDMAGSEMDPNCTFDMVQLDGETMQWTVDCPVEGGTSHGEWTATSKGSSVTGEGLVTVSIPAMGQEMAMNMNWEGHRIGDCP